MLKATGKDSRLVYMLKIGIAVVENSGSELSRLVFILKKQTEFHIHQSKDYMHARKYMLTYSQGILQLWTDVLNRVSRHE